MIRKIVNRAYNDDLRYVEISCLSTDTKPTEGIVTGSVAMEVDTGDAYFFDEESGTWKKAGGSNE